MIPFSILDLAPIVEGGCAADALRNTLDLARHAEGWGYTRYWLAEHHNMPGIASAATSVVIGYVAGGTQSIRVGSGGIMLPNHSPLVIAEQFGTLASLYPGRIDLGLGRAPGTDPRTTRALRRDALDAADSFAEDVVDLQALLGPDRPGTHVRAVPGTNSNVPIWLLGSSLYSARLAAALGLPFAFASHFAPALLLQALAMYRAEFQPSAELAHPYVMVVANVFAAETDAQARRLFTSQEQAFLNLRRGTPGRLPPPLDSTDGLWSANDRDILESVLTYSIVGAPATVRQGIERFVALTSADELMVSGHIFDHAARLRSFELVAEIRA
jgi:luciferase family oxidoreductase group 1